MAVVFIKSTAITNADGPPVVLTNASVGRGELIEAVGTAEVASGDSINSTYRLARVKSNSRVSRVLISSDAVTAAAADVGIYRTAADGGAVVDADFFASAQSIAAAIVNTDITHEADAADAGASFGLQDVEKPLWLALGLTADPMIEYDVALTLTAAATAAGTVSLKVQYVQ